MVKLLSSNANAEFINKIIQRIITYKNIPERKNNKNDYLFKSNPVTWLELLLTIYQYSNINMDMEAGYWKKQMICIHQTVADILSVIYSKLTPETILLEPGRSFLPPFVEHVSGMFYLYRPVAENKQSIPNITNVLNLTLVFGTNTGIQSVIRSAYENIGNKKYNSWSEILSDLHQEILKGPYNDNMSLDTRIAVASFLLFISLVTNDKTGLMDYIKTNPIEPNSYHFMYEFYVFADHKLSNEYGQQINDVVEEHIVNEEVPIAKTFKCDRKGKAPWSDFSKTKADNFIAVNYYDADMSTMLDYIFATMSFTGRKNLAFRRIANLGTSVLNYEGNMPIIAKSMLNSIESGNFTIHNLHLKYRLLDNIKTALNYVIEKADNVDKEYLSNLTTKEEILVENQNMATTQQYMAPVLMQTDEPVLEIGNIYTSAANMLNSSLDLVAVNRDGISTLNHNGNKNILIHSYRFYVTRELLKSKGLNKLTMHDFDIYIKLLKACYDSCSPLLLDSSYSNNLNELIEEYKSVMNTDIISTIKQQLDTNSPIEQRLLVTLFIDQNLNQGFDNLGILSENKIMELNTYRTLLKNNATTQLTKHVAEKDVPDQTEKFVPTPAIDTSNEHVLSPSTNESLEPSHMSAAQQKLAALLGEKVKPQQINIEEHLKSLVKVIVENNSAINAISLSKEKLTEEYNQTIASMDKKINMYDSTLNDAISQFQELCEEHNLDFTEMYHELNSTN